MALVAALCFLAGAVGWVLGQGRPPGAGSADVGFLRDMRSHHEGAITLAQVELDRGTVRDVRIFADEIMRFQAYEIGLMDRMQIEWGHRPEDRPEAAMGWMGEEVAVDDMPGMATEQELDALRTAEGDAADALFVALVIDHHAAGVAMAEAGAREADDADVRELAERIAEVQRDEIGELVAAAERAGLDLEPAGVTYDVYDPDRGLPEGGHGHGG